MTKEQDERARRRLSLLKIAEVPERYLRAVFDTTPEETDALQIARQWAADPDLSLLVLDGGVGVGKTAAAAWLVNRLGGFFTSAVEIKPAFGFESRGQLMKLETVKFLVVDDLGVGYDSTGYFQQGFDDLVDVRYRDCLRTCITTNMGAQEFKTRWPRVADRVRGSGIFAAVGGASLRRKVK